jgi:arylsulfatase A-like enzyme
MNVLVVVARGLRPDYLGCYGNDWVATPGLDRLAAEGVVFDWHFADCPDAAGARRAFRTGRHAFPPENAAVEPITDLLATLRQHKIGTTLVVDASRSPLPEFAAGWKQVKEVSAKGDATSLERTMEATVKALERAARREHSLLWVELATLLPPWDLPDDFRDRYFEEEETDDEAEDEDEEDLTESLTPLSDPTSGLVDSNDDLTLARLQRSYAGAVAYLDAGLEMLFEELRKRGTLDELTIIVMADHGLPLGEHGIVGVVRPWLHEELIHVPLFVRLPGGTEAGRRVSALTQSVDLLPTLLDAFGLPLSPTHGHSLLPLARGASEQVRPYACAGLQVGDAVEWCLRTPDWGLLLPVQATAGDPPRPTQLYVKPDDRHEVNDLRSRHLELSEQLEQTLHGFVAASQQPGPLEAPSLPEDL